MRLRALLLAAAAAVSAAPSALGPGAYTARIAALPCAACVTKVTETMEAVAGIAGVTVSRSKSLVTFTVKSGAKVSVEELQEQLEDAAREMGMGADYRLSGIKARETETSRYKLHVDEAPSSYRFDASGNPLAADSPAKSVRSSRKASSDGCSATGDSCGAAARAVYVCPMGDYRGPNTSNGLCPKCGMKLQKQ